MSKPLVRTSGQVNKIAIPIETKTFQFELKSVDEEQGIVEGYLSTFGNVDGGKDRVIKGAFKKTLADAKSRMQNKTIGCLYPVLWMHFPEQPLGKCLDAYEDEQGLYVKFWLDITTNDKGIPNNPQAVMVFSGYKNGYISEQSMGYKAIQKDYDGQGVRNLKECQLFELSCITSNFAMNDEALATSVKTSTALKGHSSMTVKPDTTKPERKDFNDRYRIERIKDWKSTDFNNLVVALQSAIMDIFSIGDTPQADLLDTILNGSGSGSSDPGNKIGFIDALKDYVQKGVDLDVSNYIDENPYFGSASDSYSSYGYMSRNDALEGKVGAVVSKENADRLKGHVTNLLQVKDMVGTVADDMQRYITGNAAFASGSTSSDNAAAAAGTEDDAPKKAASSVRPSIITPNETKTTDQPLASTGKDFATLISEWIASEKTTSNTKAA